MTAPKPPPNKTDPVGILLALLALILLGFLVLALVWTWPIWLLLLVTLIALGLASDLDNPVGKASTTILTPIFLGLAFLCGALFIFNALRHIIHPKWITGLERSLVLLRLWVIQHTDVSLPVFLILMTLLFVIASIVPRFRLAHRAFLLQKFPSYISIFLITVTSFSFFGQVPLQTLVHDAHKELSQYDSAFVMYTAHLKKEWTAVGTYLAEDELIQSCRDLDSTDVQSYRDLFEHIARQDRAPDVYYGRTLSIRLADRQFDENLQTPELERWIGKKSRDEGFIVESVASPESPQEFKQAESKVHWLSRKASSPSQEVEKALALAAERREVLVETFSRVVCSGIPEIGDIAGEYIKELASKLSTRLVEKLLSRNETFKAEPLDYLGTKADLGTVTMPETIRVLKATGLLNGRTNRLETTKEVRSAIDRGLPDMVKRKDPKVTGKPSDRDRHGEAKRR